MINVSIFFISPLDDTDAEPLDRINLLESKSLVRLGITA